MVMAALTAFLAFGAAMASTAESCHDVWVKDSEPRAMFPDSEDYEKNVRDRLRQNYAFETKMYNAAGKQVHFVDMVEADH